MAKPAKFATLQEAIAIHAKGDEFVYNNPCSQCKKECSTPTLDIWKKRIALFGGVKEMYEQYVCRDCRKSEKGDKPAKAKAPPSKEIAVIKAPLIEVKVLPPEASATAHSVACMHDLGKRLPDDVKVEVASTTRKDLPTIVVEPVRGIVVPVPGEKVIVKPGQVIVRVWEVGGGEPRRFVGSHAYDVG